MDNYIKRFGIVSMIVLCLAGCTSTNDKQAKNIPINDKKNNNELSQMTLQEFEKAIKDKKDFMVMITQSTCTYCNTMKRTLLPYFREHKDVPFYEIEVDMLGNKVEDINKNFAKLKELVPKFSGSTPEYLYFKGGQLKEQKNGEMSEIAWNNFMIECGLVKGKTQEEEKVRTTLAESTNFKELTLAKLTTMIEERKDFYLLFAQEDRYSAAFTETLKKQAEENKLDIYILNNTKVTQPTTQKESEEMQKQIEVINKVITIEYAPSLFHIKKGKVFDSIKDNIPSKELKTWFEKQIT